MARIDSKVLFLTTSPRTPEKMIPEIKFLYDNFEGLNWNESTQKSFMLKMAEEDFFEGSASKDPAFSARDRITRAPKSLGFVSLFPYIGLTPAGKALISGKRTEEVFLRQLIKFQVPSPYHKPSDKAATFWVKPYLELIRLVRHFGTLRFDELMMFGMQLTDYRLFDEIVAKIDAFRTSKALQKGKMSYTEFRKRYFIDEIKQIYKEELSRGETKTRESLNTSEDNFIATKARNMRDYADACFRYLRATGMVNVSHVGKSLSIVPQRIKDVDFILTYVNREPCFIDNLKLYEDYLGNARLPILLIDNKQELINKIKEEFPNLVVSNNFNIDTLKDIYSYETQLRKESILDQQIKDLKSYKDYDDIQNLYDNLKNVYDAPLMLEWNTWRAMTMIDGGKIHASLNFDDFGKPISTAGGNIADIICNYKDFDVAVEVTMAMGRKQYEMETEPIAYHLGKLKKETGRPAFCLFIAPTIHPGCVTYCYSMYEIPTKMYGGKSEIVPLPINVFRKMVEDAYKASYVPNSDHLKRFFIKCRELRSICNDEEQWFTEIKQSAMNWLNL